MTLAYLPPLRLAPCRDTALRIHLRPTRSSALSSPSLSLFLPLSLPPFHLDIPSPPPSLRHRAASLRWISLASSSFSSSSTSFSSSILPPARSLARSIVLFLVYFSHPRTVEMQFASELLLPPSQPVAASNNRRRSEQLTHRGICCQREGNFTNLIEIEISG